MNIKKSVWKQQYWEYLLPALAVLSLLLSCIIVSSKKFFWNDELLSFYLLDDRSLLHMLVAWSDKFNQAPPLYFILGWVWDKVFVSTELPLRLFSSVTIGLALLMVWAVLRRTYDFWSTTVGTLSVFCLSDLVLYHNAELRMYGLFTAVCAFGLVQFDSINRSQKISWQSLAINSLAHCLIVLTHLYGAFYSAAILAAFVVRDRYFGILRTKIYVSVLAAWVILILLSPLIINQSNNSAKWFHAVNLAEAINLLIPFWMLPWFILALLVTSAFLQVIEHARYIRQKNSFAISGRTVKAEISSEGAVEAETSLLIFAISFLLVPLLAWVVTVTIKPLLNDRYIIPTITISWAIFLTYLISRIIPVHQKSISIRRTFRGTHLPHFNLRTIVLLALTLTIILYPIYYARKGSSPWRGDGYLQKPGANDLSYGYSELPIAMEAGHDFLPHFYYSSKPSRYFHILDWETAVKNVGSAYATGDYVHLNALSKNYPFIQSVQSTDFLKKYDRFLVLNEEDQKWFEWRVQNNPTYQIKKLGIEQGANAPLTMFLVRRY